MLIMGTLRLRGRASATALSTVLAIAALFLIAPPGEAATTAPTVTNTIAVGDGADGIAMNALTNTIYVGNIYSRNVSVIDGTTGIVTKTIPTNGESHGVAVNPTTNTIYVANHEDALQEDPYSDRIVPLPEGILTVIDGATGTVTKTIAVGEGAYGLAVDAATNTIYVANSENNTVSVVNGATDTITKTFTASSRPNLIAVNTTTKTLYVSHSAVLGGRDGDTVSVIDATAGTTTTTITVGREPYEIAVDATTNSVLVANEGLDEGTTVSVIDGAANTVTSTVTVGRVPLGVAVNEATHTAYVTNSSFLSSSSAGSIRTSMLLRANFWVFALPRGHNSILAFQRTAVW